MEYVSRPPTEEGSDKERVIILPVFSCMKIVFAAKYSWILFVVYIFQCISNAITYYLALSLFDESIN